MFHASRRWRLFLLVPVLLLRAMAQAPTTTINDTVYQADGTPAQGILLISWPAFTTAGGQAVAPGTTSVTLGAGGSLSVALVPNQGATPVNTVYTVVYQLSDMVKTEYWSVPTTSPTNLATVRTTLGATSTASQMVTQQYVEAAVAGKANDSAVVHLAGSETITGVKQFTAAPSLPTPVQSTDAANKAYVDSSVQNVGGGGPYVSTAGGTMTGPLVLSGDPSAANQAADKHYVDIWAAVKADLIGGLVPPSELASGTPGAGTCLLGNQTWGSCGGGGGSSSVNGGQVASPNFNATSPGAQSSFLNCSFQNTGSNVSLECPYGNTSSSFALGSLAVLNDQANSYGAGLQDFSMASLKLPAGAGYSPAVTGTIGFDTTANMPVININGVTQQIALTTSNTSGQASTALALAASPAQCTGSFATGIQANGNANCSTADVIQLAETTQPSGIANYGIFWFDSTTHTPRVVDNNGQVVQLGLMNAFNSDANTLEEYNGTNPQTLNVYGTRADASDYERMRLAYDTTDGYFFLGAEAAGTGTQRGLGFWMQGGLRWVIDEAFNLKPWSDNIKDVGTPTLRPKHLYAGTYADLTSGALVTEIPNQASTGTTLYQLAKVTGSPATAIIASTSDTNGVIGVVADGAGTTGSAQIARGGQASCVFDGPTTAGDYVQISSSTAGDCHDASASYPGTGQVLGRVLSTNASAGTYAMLIAGSETQAPQQGAVTSIFGRSGTIAAQAGDYSVGQITGAAPLASPAFTGTPTAPTQATSDTSSAIATDAWVKAQGYGGAGSTAWGNITGTLSNQTDLASALALLAPRVSPSFTTPALGVATAMSFNGLALTANSTGFGIAGGTTAKTLTLANTMTLAGVDGSTLNIGAGGTLQAFGVPISGLPGTTMCDKVVYGRTNYPNLTLDARDITGNQVWEATCAPTALGTAASVPIGKLLLGYVNVYVDGPSAGSYTDGNGSGVGTPAIILPSGSAGIEGAFDYGATVISFCTGSNAPVTGCTTGFPQRSFSITSTTISGNTLTVNATGVTTTNLLIGEFVQLVGGAETSPFFPASRVLTVSNGLITVTVPSTVSACASSCGTLYAMTPVIGFGPAGSGSVYYPNGNGSSSTSSHTARLANLAVNLQNTYGAMGIQDVYGQEESGELTNVWVLNNASIGIECAGLSYGGAGNGCAMYQVGTGNPTGSNVDYGTTGVIFWSQGLREATGITSNYNPSASHFPVADIEFNGVGHLTNVHCEQVQHCVQLATNGQVEASKIANVTAGPGTTDAVNIADNGFAISGTDISEVFTNESGSNPSIVDQQYGNTCVDVSVADYKFDDGVPGSGTSGKPIFTCHSGTFATGIQQDAGVTTYWYGSTDEAQINGVTGAAAFNGTVTVPTPSTSDNSTKAATTAYVQNQAYATLASPTFTGTPNAPTAAAGTNTTQIATTAYVQAAILAPTQLVAFPGYNTSNQSVFPTSGSTAGLWQFTVPFAITTSKVAYKVGTTADNTSNSYEIGVYNASGTLVLSYQAAGTSFAPTVSTIYRQNWSQGSITLVPGKYYLALSSSCTSACATFYASGGTTATYYSNSAASSVASSGTLNSTITAPGTGNESMTANVLSVILE